MNSALVLILLFAGCSSQTAVAPGDEMKLGVGESKRVDPGGLLVRFAAVTADSRCPRSVQCVWAGDGAVRLDVTRGEESASVIVHTSGRPDMPAEAEALGHRFKLVELAPYPETPRSIKADEYRATIVVTAL
ncbi:MAG: hypothetical protein ACYC7A_08605 [Thermoanaerobaculia bacterium]